MNGVRSINVFKGSASEAVHKLFEQVKDVFPDEVAALSNSFGSKAMELWSLSLKAASPWGDRAASTLVFEPAASGGVAKVFSEEKHPNFMFMEMIENGVKSWSIKDALLASKRAKTDSNGIKSIVVPFRYRTPGKKKAGSGFAGVMTNDVYALIRKGKNVGPEHGNMAGLKKYGGQGHSQFLTFRTVTENSTGWQYPEIPATPVFEDVQKKVSNMVSSMLQKYVEEKVKEIRAAGSKK